MSATAEQRAALLAAARAMGAARLNVSTAGNASLRLAEGFLITPSGMAPEACTPADLVVVHADGSVEGRLARRHGFPWDAILGAELARDYKPKAVVYQNAAAALDAEPAQTLMVAAHSSDLQPAAAAGLRTAFVARPDEHGPGRGESRASVPVDLSVADLLELAERLGC